MRFNVLPADNSLRTSRRAIESPTQVADYVLGRRRCASGYHAAAHAQRRTLRTQRSDFCASTHRHPTRTRTSRRCEPRRYPRRQRDGYVVPSMGGGSHREAQYVKLPIYRSRPEGPRVRDRHAPPFCSRSANKPPWRRGVALYASNLYYFVAHFKILAESGGEIWRIATLLL
jgi:hypothetical protein